MPPDADAVERSGARVASWRARLALRFAHDGERSWLAERRHEGPLVVQKALYPEGPAVCQAIVVHPPGGIANGDALDLAIAADERAHAQLTTPGAAKWYRCARGGASQTMRIDAKAGAVVEWLPQGTIVFDGARASLATRVDLAGDATFIGWEIVCLGRVAAGERFASGGFAQRTDVYRERALIWSERMRLEASSRLLQSRAGLNAKPVFGTFVAFTRNIDDRMLEVARRTLACDGDGVVSRLPGVLVGRFVGASSEGAFRYFVALWEALRPLIVGRSAVAPRIWST
ncbi:MAG TPA: urease accessory protein UreD [Casimicrobiaceae bacterium]|nr:urease accessory protein UreD [Casimicrobiaceae bacterium]